MEQEGVPVAFSGAQLHPREHMVGIPGEAQQQQQRG
jgi:hypothetical protein